MLTIRKVLVDGNLRRYLMLKVDDYDITLGFLDKYDNLHLK